MPPRVASRARALVLVARPYDLSDASYDGFVDRRLRVVAKLAAEHALHLLLLRPPQDTSIVHPSLRDVPAEELAIRLPDGSRRARLVRSWNPDALQDAHTIETTLRRLVVRFGITRAITFGPWLEPELFPVFDQLPTVHFFEEDLSRMIEIAPQSRQASVFRRIELGLRRGAPQPRIVVVISPNEQRYARRRFPGAQIRWQPFLLDQREFPVAVDTSAGDDVIVVGQFTQPRNAEGLRDVLDHLADSVDAPSVTLVSAAGVHELLADHLSTGALRVESRTDDLYRLYRSCRLSLVPARRVTGVKTTMLQAWAAGAPVVCFRAAADSIGPFAQSAALVVDDPDAAAAAVRRLHKDATLRARLARAGRTHYQTHFSPTVWEAKLSQLLHDLDAVG